MLTISLHFYDMNLEVDCAVHRPLGAPETFALNYCVPVRWNRQFNVYLLYR